MTQKKEVGQKNNFQGVLKPPKGHKNGQKSVKKRSFLASLSMSYTLSYPKNLNYGNVRYDLYFHLEPWVKVDFCKKGYFCKFLIFKF